MPETLPLFPLGSVLMPGLVQAFNVFEQRYRTLVEELGPSPRGPRASSGWWPSAPAARSARTASVRVEALYPVGCTARVEQIDALEDGRFEIVTVGHTRFRLLDIDATAGTPYLTGAGGAAR